MFTAYSIEDFVGQKLKHKDFLIHRLENLDYLPPQSVKTPHKHLFYEIYLLEEGSAIHNVDFNTFHIKNNNLFIINEEQVHHLEKNVSQELKGYRILFTKDFINNSLIPSNLLFEIVYLHNIRFQPLISIDEHSELHTYAHLLLSEYNQKTLTLENIKALLFLFLNEVKRNIISDTNDDFIYTNNQIRSYKLFLDLVETNYYKDLSLEDYANRIKISTRQLSRMIKLISNATLNTIILNRRLLQSKRLLKHSDLSISEIAYEVGFLEPSYFCKVFKKNNNVTPLQFRKEQNVL
ncbi:AraC family transcriptional regulator [Riemerella anatipestifer]|uniref:helix-turn-helix transcriptional regulator n=1 Tax=Riemerella anatipestifer TaxID=34085 RepID=UPI0030BC9AEE